MFNHSDEVQIERKKGKGYLVQNGQPFTYAEYDKVAKKWVPEPQSLDPEDIVRDMKDDVERGMKEITAHLKKIMEVIPLLEEFSVKTLKIRTEQRDKINYLNGKIGALERKLKTMQDTEKVMELTDEIEKLKSSRGDNGKQDKK